MAHFNRFDITVAPETMDRTLSPVLLQAREAVEGILGKYGFQIDRESCLTRLSCSALRRPPSDMFYAVVPVGIPLT